MPMWKASRLCKLVIGSVPLTWLKSYAWALKISNCLPGLARHLPDDWMTKYPHRSKDADLSVV